MFTTDPFQQIPRGLDPTGISSPSREINGLSENEAQRLGSMASAADIPAR